MTVNVRADRGAPHRHDSFGVKQQAHDADQHVSAAHGRPLVRRRPTISAVVRGDWHSLWHLVVDLLWQEPRRSASRATLLVALLWWWETQARASLRVVRDAAPRHMPIEARTFVVVRRCRDRGQQR